MNAEPTLDVNREGYTVEEVGFILNEGGTILGTRHRRDTCLESLGDMMHERGGVSALEHQACKRDLRSWPRQRLVKVCTGSPCVFRSSMGLTFLISCVQHIRTSRLRRINDKL